MSKYEIGNRVKLRDDLRVGEYYGNYYINGAIERLIGQWVTISGINDDCNSYNVEELPSMTFITNQMIDIEATNSVDQPEVKKIVCDVCGNEVKSYEAHFIDGKAYCHECYREIRDSINSYHSKNIWNKKYGMAKPRLFNILMGFELEVESENELSDFQRCLSAYKLKKAIGDFVTIENDGSLDDGFEIITEPMTLQYIRESQKDTIKTMLECLKANGMGQGRHTGLHIHVDRDSLGTSSRSSDEVIDNIYLIMETFEKEIIKFARREPNEYCNFISEPSREKTLSYIKRRKEYVRGNRYLAFNIQPEDTVEFRIFKSTIDFLTLMATIEFVNNVVNIAKYKNIDGLTWKDIIEYQASKNEYLIEYNESLNIESDSKIQVAGYFEIHKNEFSLEKFVQGKFAMSTNWREISERNISMFVGMLLTKQVTHHRYYDSLLNAIERKVDNQETIVIKYYDEKPRLITLKSDEREDYVIVPLSDVFNLWLEDISLLA